MAWFSLLAVLAIVLLIRVSRWYKARCCTAKPAREACCSLNWLAPQASGLGNRGFDRARFLKVFYLASFSSYYTFYLIARFLFSVRSSQLHLLPSWARSLLEL